MSVTIVEAALKRRFPPTDLIVGSSSDGETAPLIATRSQAGVIAYRDGMTCLVSTRKGRSWIIPKGTIDPGQTASDAALQEAWEEAGLHGSLSQEPIGSYESMKKLRRCQVTVYLMHISECSDTWPEMGQRQREWLPFHLAAARVKHCGLSELLKSLAESAAAA